MARIRILASDLQTGALPLICMACGRQAVVHVSKTFTFRPRWAWVTTIASLFLCLPVGLLFWIIGIVSVKRMTMDCPLCERHRHYWGWRGFWISAPLLALFITIVAFVLLITRGSISGEAFALLLIGTFVLLALWAGIATLIQRLSIRAVEILDGEIVLDRVSREFADALREDREPRHGSRRGAELNKTWTPYDPYPQAVPKLPEPRVK